MCPQVDELNSVQASARNLAIAPSEAGASDYYDVIMGGSEPDLLLDYRDSVDISELERIAEVMSVGSGSVLSVVDWDAVDKLIEDVWTVSENGQKILLRIYKIKCL